MLIGSPFLFVQTTGWEGGGGSKKRFLGPSGFIF